MLPIDWLLYQEPMTLTLYVRSEKVWLNLVLHTHTHTRTLSPRQCVCVCVCGYFTDTAASASHTLTPGLTSSSTQHLGYMYAHGLSWPVASSVALYNNRICGLTSPDTNDRHVAEQWHLQASGLLSFPCLFFSLHPLPGNTKQGTTVAYQRTQKSLSVPSFIYQMESDHMVLIGSN